MPDKKAKVKKEKPEKEKVITKNYAIAKHQYAKSSPDKIRRVVDLIRGKRSDEALAILRYLPQKGARLIEKVVKSAVANANIIKLDKDNLIISKAFVDQASIYRRYRHRARGRADVRKKKLSHITVCVAEGGIK
jgi:large subunit ribosomal protein L22